jgi:ethanolamine ammonia-lyase small subunit
MDPWAKFRAYTQARIGLPRSGDALSTPALLEFQLGHARARDAVHGEPDFARIAADLHDHGTLMVSSLAKDRHEYLIRPDLGRQLAPYAIPKGEWDLVIVVADGLSSKAVDDHAVSVVDTMLARIPGWKVAPIVLAKNARVAIGDPIARTLGAKMVAVLIGERPGLTVANSLGIYLTLNPQLESRDSDRNCISNIHEHGLTYQTAAQMFHWLATQSRELGYTGVRLKQGEFDPSLED